MNILELIKPELFLGLALTLAFFICLGNYATKVDAKRDQQKREDKTA